MCHYELFSNFTRLKKSMSKKRTFVSMQRLYVTGGESVNLLEYNLF